MAWLLTLLSEPVDGLAGTLYMIALAGHPFGRSGIWMGLDYDSTNEL